MSSLPTVQSCKLVKLQNCPIGFYILGVRLKEGKKKKVYITAEHKSMLLPVDRRIFTVPFQCPFSFLCK